MKKTLIFGFSLLAVFFGACFFIHLQEQYNGGYWDDSWYWYGKGLTENNKNGLYFITNERQNLFEHDLAPINIYNNEDILDKKAFYIHKNGDIAFEKIFEDAGPFDICGLAPAKSNGKWGYIDTTGNFVIPPQYQIATKFYNSTAFVTDRENEKDYLINSNGDILYETAIWDLYIAYSRPGEPLIFGSSSGYGLADNGRIILEPKYDYIDNYKCGYALIGNDQKCGIVDLSGNIVVPIEFDSPDDAELEFKKLKPDFSGIYDEYDNAQIRFKITDDHILTDLSGKRIYDNEVYGVIEGGNGRWFISASGKKRTLVGITDEYGKFIVEPKYNYLVDPEQPAYRDNSWYHYSLDGYTFVFGDEDNYLIDRNGNIVFKMKDITP